MRQGISTILCLGTIFSGIAAKPGIVKSISGGTGCQKPNVIIVLSDDQGYGDFSCHGNPVLLISYTMKGSVLAIFMFLRSVHLPAGN